MSPLLKHDFSVYIRFLGPQPVLEPKNTSINSLQTGGSHAVCTVFVSVRGVGGRRFFAMDGGASILNVQTSQ